MLIEIVISMKLRKRKKNVLDEFGWVWIAIFFIVVEMNYFLTCVVLNRIRRFFGCREWYCP